MINEYEEVLVPTKWSHAIMKPEVEVEELNDNRRNFRIELSGVKDDDSKINCTDKVVTQFFSVDLKTRIRFIENQTNGVTNWINFEKKIYNESDIKPASSWRVEMIDDETGYKTIYDLQQVEVQRREPNSELEQDFEIMKIFDTPVQEEPEPIEDPFDLPF